MALPLPSAQLTILNGGLGVVSNTSQNIHVCIGTSGKGPLKTFKQFSRYEESVGTFGAGPMPKSAAYSTRNVRARYLCIRVPAVAEAATTSTITKPSGKTVTTTGTPNGGYDVIFAFTAGGTVGTTGISYKWSTNGGVSYTTAAALGTATTVVLTGTGVTINLTALDTYTSGQEIRFWTKPASGSVGPVTVTHAGTSDLTLDGTPVDEYEVVIEFMTGGTFGSTGITFRYSLDGGREFSPETQLGTATSFELLDGTEPSGVSFSGESAETVVAGDKIVAKTTMPAIQASDVVEVLESLRLSHVTWRFVHVANECTAAKASSVGSKLASLAGLGLFTYAIMNARDRIDGEVDADGIPSTDYADRLEAEYLNLVSDRLGVSAGRARVLCPITGRQNRRPAGWIVTPRLIEKSVQVDPGRKRDGALSSDVNLYNSDGALVELDSRVRDQLHGQRFLTLRTYDRQPGVYVTRGNVMSAPGARLNRIAQRAALDIACETFYAMLESTLESEFRTNPLEGPQPDEGAIPGKTPVPGALREADARVIDEEFYTALVAAVVTPGYVDAIKVEVDREEPTALTGKIIVRVSIASLVWVDTAVGEIGYEAARLKQS